jgi:TolA-binding protein
MEPGAAPAVPSAAMATPLAGPADRAREALNHYNQAIAHLKSGDWAGFGTELDAMRGLLEDMSPKSDGH